MTPRQLLLLTVRPALAFLGPRYASREAEVMLVAIAQQESGILHRRQYPSGPARSWWQEEPPTVVSVISKWEHGRQRLKDLGVLNGVGLPANHEIMTWIECSELAACIVARGILWLEPSPLPRIGDERGAWAYYADHCWRPGKPRPEKWPAAYENALDATAG